jgi:predicted double-glycine peptidase
MAISWSFSSSAADIVVTDGLIESMPVRTWKAMRDAGTVKQRYDYSCGAASLAGLLTMQFGTETSELDVIDRIGVKPAFSMADLARVAHELGFRPFGLMLDYDTLTRFERPVIVYLNYWDDGHFSVLKAIDEHGVWLADPAWGNTRMRRERFERFWRGDGEARGKVLAVLPAGYSPDVTLPKLSSMSGSGMAVPAIEWNGLPWH